MINSFLRCVTLCSCAFTLFFLAPPCPATRSQARSSKPHAKQSVRTLVFPGDKVLGTVLIGEKSTDVDTRGQMHYAASGTGTFRIVVRGGDYVLLDINRRAVEDPVLLESISPAGIDVLRVGFAERVGAEGSVIDRALGYVSHFENLSVLLIDHTSASDEAMSVVKKLRSLRQLSCSHTKMTGLFFKDLVQLPLFSQLDVSWCPLETANLKYLPQLRKLTFLNVSRAGIEINGIREIARCSMLKRLRLAQNILVKDDGLKCLAALKHLEWIDLKDTGITLAGLRSLQGLPLSKINLSDVFNNARDLETLKKIFPGVVITFEPKVNNAYVRHSSSPSL